MSYTINRSDPASNAIVVEDSTLNSQTSIDLVGRNYTNYGTVIASTQIHMLENFCNGVRPDGAVPGQLWYNNNILDDTNTAGNGKYGLNINVATVDASPTWESVLTAENANAAGYIDDSFGIRGGTGITVNGTFADPLDDNGTDYLEIELSGNVSFDELSWDSGRNVLATDSNSPNNPIIGLGTDGSVSTTSAIRPWKIVTNAKTSNGSMLFRVADKNVSAVGETVIWEDTLILKSDLSAEFGGNVTIAGVVEADEYQVKSSLRYKTNILDLSSHDAVLDLRPVSYIRKDSGKNEIGFIAEEVHKLFPEVVALNDAGEVESLDYSRLVAPLTKKVQHQAKQIADLQSQIAEILKLLK